MFTRAKYLLAGVALALALSVAADQFPSRPTFQGITVALPSGANSLVKYVANESRTVQTVSCDPVLQFTNLPSGHFYIVEAFLDFAGNGITANGWKVGWGGTNVSTNNSLDTATTNATSPNNAPVANLAGNVGGIFTAVFNQPGVDTLVTMTGSVGTFGGTGTSCISWAQNTTNATATTLVYGWFRLTLVQ